MDEETQDGKSSVSILSRYRSPTFSRDEVDALMSIIERYKHTILNKSTNATMNQSKELCWEKIANIFNSKGFKHERSVDTLKTKWENLKRDARKMTKNLADESNTSDNDISRQIATMMCDVENNAPLEGQNLDDGDDFNELVSNNEKPKPNLKRKHSWETFEEKDSDESNDGDDDKRRYRSPTFSRIEVEALMSIIDRYKYTILNKSTNAAANQSKEHCWEKIANVFNSKGFKHERNVDNLKNKWENLKREARGARRRVSNLDENSSDNNISRQIVAMISEVESNAPLEGPNLDDDEEFNDGDDDKRSNRSLNFAPQECSLLLECVRNEKSIVFSKEYNANAIGLKNKAWKRITEAFNKKSPQKRTLKVLRTKFNNLKTVAKSMGIKDAVKSFDRNDMKHEKLINESSRIKSEPMFEVELENGDDFEHHNSDSNHFAPDPLGTVLNSDSGIGSSHSSSWSPKEIVKLKLELLNYKMETAKMERQQLIEASRAEAATRESRAITTALELRTSRLKAAAAAAALPPHHPALLFTPEEQPAERYLQQYGHT